MWYRNYHIVNIQRIFLRQCVFIFVFQDKDVLEIKQELSRIYDCKWPTPSLFDVGEEAHTKLVWHGFFDFDISEDVDLKWLAHKTPTSIKIQIASFIDGCLSVLNMSRHDKLVSHFIGSTPVHNVLGKF